MVQWLRLCTSTAEDAVSILCGGTRIPHDMRHRKKEKKTVWSTPHNFTSMHNYAKEFPGGLVAKTALPMQGDWVQFLVEDLFHYRP